MKFIKKLHQRSGATFILALMLLLIASMVSVVVVTASTTALRRTRSEKTTTQNMLLLQSGAKYLRDSLEGATFQRTQVTSTTQTPSPPVWEISGTAQPDALQTWVLNFLKTTDGTFTSAERWSNSLTVRSDQLSRTVQLTLRYAEGKYLVFHLENGAEPEDASSEKQELYLTFFIEVQQLPTVGEETSTKTSYTLLSQKIEAYRKEAANEETAFPFG